MKSRLEWNQEEDILLKNLKEIGNIQSWKQIAMKLNETNKQKTRTPKQCRERFINFSKFYPSKAEPLAWKIQEIYAMFQKYSTIGPKWASIAQNFQERSQNGIKNKFYSSVRRLVRQINLSFKKSKEKYRRPLCQNSIIYFLTDNSIQSLSAQMKKQFGNIRTRMIEIILLLEEDKINQLALIELGKIIRRYNDKIRFCSVNKWHNEQNTFREKRKKSPQMQEDSEDCVSSLEQKNEKKRKSGNNNANRQNTKERESKIELLENPYEFLHNSQSLDEQICEIMNKNYQCKQFLFDN